MDSERQPLLSNNPANQVRYRGFRPLTQEEVLNSRNDATWRRTRICLVLMFWAIMAMFLSMLACLLIQAPKCNSYPTPTVPPVHMTFAPLINSGGETDNKHYVLSWLQSK